MRKNHSQQGKQSGFTLIELLTVIAVITILAAILLPAVSRIRKSSELAKCVSNLRQTKVALDLYTTENSWNYPPALDRDASDGGWWFDIVLNDTISEQASRLDIMENSTVICPAASADGIDGSPIGYTYGMNVGLPSTDKDPNKTLTERGASHSLIEEPALAMLLIDAQNPWLGAGQYKRITSVDWRHDNKWNMVFCDGHVETRTIDQIPTDRNDTFWTGLIN